MKRQIVFNELKKHGLAIKENLKPEVIETMYRYLVFFSHGYVEYDITVTFLPHLKCTTGHKPTNIRKQMIRLYLNELMRKHMFEGDSRWAKNYHNYQPFSEFYMEEHTHGAIYRPHLDENIIKEYQYADRKHYHGMMAVHPELVNKMDELLGENTLNQFGEGVMTSMVRRVDNIGWVGYMMKEHQKYTDTNLFFGPDLTKNDGL